jgi:MHS family proline/betaine transporter-like MFS transporter
MTQAIKSFRSEADTSMASSDDVIRRHPSRVIIPLSIGNALEWFDIVIYGYLAVTISRVFFPAQNELNGLLIVLATFGASFAMRPIGSIVLGAYADASGRKKALNLSIILMMVGTLAIAVAPTYAQAGVTGSIMIVGAKLVQGFSAGGEYGSATALLAEQDEKRRGFYASWQVASQGMTVLLAAFFGYVLNSAFTPAQLDTWAWRIPFVFGLSVGPVALYIRRNLAESQEFSESIEKAPPVFASIAEHRGRIIASLGILVIATTAAYTMLFMPTYAVKQLGMPATVGFLPTIVMGVIQMTLSPVFGNLSDRYGRTTVMLPGVVAILLGIIPAYLLLAAHPNAAALIAVEAFIAVALSAYAGPLPAAMADLFPVKLRGLGLSMSYSLGVAIFGGFAPFISQWLISRTGMVIAPAFPLLFSALVSVVSLGFARRYGLRGALAVRKKR